MRKCRLRSAGKGGEEGYALLLVVFLTTLMLLATIVAAPSIRTERKREKEEEMIWRGKQYIRGIKLYYRKNGRFPTSLDDLTKPKNGSLRYLRQAYKDPMNKEDGAWRLIYVGAAGQLIGSLKPPQTLQLQGAGGAGQLGTPAASLNGPLSTQGSGTSQSAFGPQTGGAFGPQSGGSATGTAGSAGSGQNGSTFGPGNASGTGASSSSPSSLAASDTSSIIGGNIIGIGSKVDRKSVIVYEKATNYHLFEFIWDPSKDALAAGGGVPGGTSIGTPAGTAGTGQTPGQGIGQGFGSSFGQPGQNPSGLQPGQPGNNPNPAPQPPLSPNP